MEYVGRGIELFVGFLIVVAILFLTAIPLLLVQFFALGAGSVFEIVITLAYYAVLFVLIQIAIFRARRYKTSRTVWRGIRFGLEGKSLRFAKISCLYGLLVLVTLGFAAPWRNVAVQRYLMDRTRFGGEHFRFDGSGRDLIPIWSLVILTGYTAIALIIVVNLQLTTYILDVFTRAGGLEEGIAIEELTGRINPYGWWPCLLLPVSFVLQLWYSVRQFTYFVNRTTLGATSFASSLRTPQVIWYIIIFRVLVFFGWAATFAIFAALIFVQATGGAGGQMLLPILLVLLLFFV